MVINAVVSKYCDHVPLYRQWVMLARDAGVEISRGTMDGWVMRVGYLLSAIVMAMRKEVLRGGYIQADETTVMVERPEEKKGRNHQAYLWQFGNPGGSVVFPFHLGRGPTRRSLFSPGTGAFCRPMAMPAITRRRRTLPCMQAAGRTFAGIALTR